MRVTAGIGVENGQRGFACEENIFQQTEPPPAVKRDPLDDDDEEDDVGGVGSLNCSKGGDEWIDIASSWVAMVDSNGKRYSDIDIMRATVERS